MTVEEMPVQVFSPEFTAEINSPKAKIKRAARRSAAEVAHAVADDLREAWFWDAHPPTLREVWRDRTVPYESIPVEEHRCLTLDAAAGMVYEATDWLLRCQCENTSAKERGHATIRNRVRFALRWGWMLWNLLVAIPLTLVIYPLVWIHQRPSRAVLGWVLGGLFYGVVSASTGGAP